MSKVTNREDIIDSRDIIERIEELEADQADLIGQLGNGEITEAEMVTFDGDEGLELDHLRGVAEDGENYAPDWEYGATLIRESYFTEYAIDMLKDCGDLPAEIPHYIAIDEEATTDNLKVDYTEIEFNGVTYLVR